jgi:hypothetical protein
MQQPQSSESTLPFSVQNYLANFGYLKLCTFQHENNALLSSLRRLCLWCSCCGLDSTYHVEQASILSIALTWDESATA